jgi:hypothetical protein
VSTIRTSLAFVIVLLCDIANGQVHHVSSRWAILTDTSSIILTELPDDPELNPRIWIKDDTRWTADWVVYFDSSKSSIALRSEVEGDSTTVIEFWPDGKIKAMDRHVFLERDRDGVPTWLYSEAHCRNGQLLQAFLPNSGASQLITRFYCNGQKRTEFVQNGIVCEGSLRGWFENGQLEYEEFWQNGKQEGWQRYWDASGSLIKTEVYRDGVLLNVR